MSRAEHWAAVAAAKKAELAVIRQRERGCLYLVALPIWAFTVFLGFALGLESNDCSVGTNVAEARTFKTD